MSELWTIERILAWIEDYLGKHADEHPRQSAQWLVSDVTGLSRIELYTHFDRPVSEDERACLRDYVKRRAQGEPLQYITGKAPFRHLVLATAPEVLIPRPETEVLVSCAIQLVREARSAEKEAFEQEKLQQLSLLAQAKNSDNCVPKLIYQQALQLLGSQALSAASIALDEQAEYIPWSEVLSVIMQTDYTPSECRIADICTGSGCIALSLASELPSSRVLATDISHPALALAYKNRELLGLTEQVEIIESNLASALIPKGGQSFDLVVSNPPYIPSTVLAELPSEVTSFEPRLALDGGEDGLDLYRRLLSEAFILLKPGGWLVVELHEDCLQAAQALAEQAGYDDVSIVFDLSSRPRIVQAQKPTTSS